MDWQRDSKDWPHRERSRLTQAGGLTWHVQMFEGPCRAAAAARQGGLALQHFRMMGDVFVHEGRNEIVIVAIAFT